MYDLNSFEQVFDEKIGGKPDSYIKCKEIEQSDDGTLFAAVYINDGYFRLRVFSEVARETEEEIERDELDINSVLGIDNSTIPIDNFPDPYITCCFCTSEFIYVNLYHNYTTTHYSFVYNI